jgi:hypothetical protein
MRELLLEISWPGGIGSRRSCCSREGVAQELRRSLSGLVGERDQTRAELTEAQRCRAKDLTKIAEL